MDMPFYTERLEPPNAEEWRAITVANSIAGPECVGHYTCLVKAVLAGMRAGAAEWISVEERLPEWSVTHTPVLIVVDGDVHAGRFVNGIYLEDKYNTQVHPTHWRYFPEPPK